MKSGELRGAFLSTNTNSHAGDKTHNYVLHPPFFIAFVMRSFFIYLFFSKLYKSKVSLIANFSFMGIVISS